MNKLCGILRINQWDETSITCSMKGLTLTFDATPEVIAFLKQNNPTKDMFLVGIPTSKDTVFNAIITGVYSPKDELALKHSLSVTLTGTLQQFSQIPAGFVLQIRTSQHIFAVFLQTKFLPEYQATLSKMLEQIISLSCKVQTYQGKSTLRTNRIQWQQDSNTSAQAGKRVTVASKKQVKPVEQVKPNVEANLVNTSDQVAIGKSVPQLGGSFNWDEFWLTVEQGKKPKNS